MLLAASGLPVRIYEAQDRIGGRSAAIEAEGYRFDRGPTFFMMPHVLEEIFRASGRRLTDYVDLKRLDPMYRLLFGRGGDEAPLQIDASQRVEAMVRRFDAIEAGAGEAFRRFLTDNRRKLDLAEPILRKPIRSVFDLAGLDGLRAAPVIKPFQSVHQQLSGYFDDPHIRIALSFQSKYLGMSPYECPSLFTILSFIEYEYGIWHPVGGCNALCDAMARACEEMGVDIRTSAPVERITFEARRASGVVVRGEHEAHEHVVVNADATWAMKNLVPERLRGKWTDRAIDAKRYSCSTAMLYLGVEGEVDLPHHTIYVSGDYEGNLEDITTNGRLSEDPSFYVCNPTRVDPSMAPEGCSALYVLAPTPNTRSGIDWSREEGPLRRRLLDQMGRRLGLEDLESRIRVERRLNPDDWAAGNINFGATFNLAHNLGQMLHKRPKHAFPGLEGLWLVGGGTHPGSGLPVIYLSAQITSRLLCERLGVAYAGKDVGPVPPLHREAEATPVGAA
jgi:phytoene desaturase